MPAHDKFVGHELVFARFSGAHLNGDVRQMHSILAVALEVHPQVALKAAGHTARSDSNRPQGAQQMAVL